MVSATARWLRGWSSTAEPSKRQPAVEGLRALAMSMVFFGHFEGMFRCYLAPDSFSAPTVAYFGVWGHRGISIFLLITGYFVYGQFLDRRVSYLPFIKRRLWRICSLYWSVLAIYLVLSKVFPAASKLPHGFNASSLYIFENVLLLPGLTGSAPIITVSWALSYLVLAYLVIPALVLSLAMSRWTTRQRVVFIVACALLYLEACKLYGLNSRAVMIAAGMLLYESLRTHSVSASFSRAGEAAAVCLLILAFTLWYLKERGLLWFLPPVNLPAFYEYLFLAIALYYFCGYCFAYDGFLKKLLSRPAMCFLGKMSYSYYLFHGLTLKGLSLVLSRWMPAGLHSSLLFWCALPVCYAATLCTSTALFVAVGRPLALRYPAASPPARTREVIEVREPVTIP